jgi:hypothetical protein
MYTLFLELDTIWRRVFSFMPGRLYPPKKELPAPIGWEVGWNTEQAWTLLKRTKILTLPGLELRTFSSPAHNIPEG